MQIFWNSRFSDKTFVSVNTKHYQVSWLLGCSSVGTSGWLLTSVCRGFEPHLPSLKILIDFYKKKWYNKYIKKWASDGTGIHTSLRNLVLRVRLPSCPLCRLEDTLIPSGSVPGTERIRILYHIVDEVKFWGNVWRDCGACVSSLLATIEQIKDACIRRGNGMEP